MRETWLQIATKRAASLAFAGIVASVIVVFASGAGRALTDVSGPARVIDGDTIDVAGTRVRLEGIDAPESDQTCGSAAATWACGAAATRHLVEMTTGKTVTCQARGTDIYGRVLGVCTAGGIELNANMVQSGLAWAFVRYSHSYVAAETQARSNRVGIWQSASQPAWEYRASRWTGSLAAAPSGCPIKGNISHNGHVYHMPWDPWYARTSIDERRGERWFCTEAEALAAGWRHAGLH